MTLQLFDSHNKPLSVGARMASFMALTEPCDLRKIVKEIERKSNIQLAMVETASLITKGLRHEAIRAGLIGNRNVFSPTPEARQFWADHADKSPDAIWDLWVKDHPERARVSP